MAPSTPTPTTRFQAFLATQTLPQLLALQLAQARAIGKASTTYTQQQVSWSYPLLLQEIQKRQA